jgi:nitroreductase
VVAVISRARPHVKIPEWEQALSAGAVAMTLVIAAKAMGFSTSWLTEWYAFDRRILDALGLEPDERIAGFVHIGGRALEPPVERGAPGACRRRHAPLGPAPMFYEPAKRNHGLPYDPFKALTVRPSAG